MAGKQILKKPWYWFVFKALYKVCLGKRGETGTQRRSHVETEAETGGRQPPAQGWTPGAPRNWTRQGGPSPGASAGSSALGPLDLRRLVSRTRGRWMSAVLSPLVCGHLL